MLLENATLWKKSRASSTRKVSRVIQPTGRERTFAEDELIVSKTDLKGRLTYINTVFSSISDYSEMEILGSPHSVIRHPDMPRCIFKLLWETIQDGREIFAYVVNLAKNGDHYWVFAHVTPSFDASGAMIGYHSNRRVASRSILDNTIIPLYRSLLQTEAQHTDRKAGLAASSKMLEDLLKEKGVQYDEFILSI